MNKNLSPEVKEIYKMLARKYGRYGVMLNEKSISELFNKTIKESKRKYLSFKEPKICSLNIYLAQRVFEKLNEKYILKGLSEVDLKKKNESVFAEAIRQYFKFINPQLTPYINREIFKVSLEKRQKKWDSFEFPELKMQKAYIKVVKARNDFAKRQGYESFIEKVIDENKINQKDFDEFTKKIDSLIDQINVIIPGEDWGVFSDYCPICRLPDFPFKSHDDVFDYFVKTYPEIKKFSKKIKITSADKQAQTMYNSKKDIFEITIDSYFNIRHQLLILIHELSHVYSYIKSFEKNITTLEKGRYYAEQTAIEIEMSVLKNLSKDFYKASLFDILKTFHRVLFLIDLYTNPDQNLSKLYAKNFVRCHPNFKQVKNPLYILDERIVAKPFSTLPHAVAYYKNLSSQLSS